MSLIRIASNSDSNLACTDAGSLDWEDPILRVGPVVEAVTAQVERRAAVKQSSSYSKLTR